MLDLFRNVAIGLPLRMRGHSPRLPCCEQASYQQALTLNVSVCNKPLW